jgi:hypothetical protein
MTGRQIISRYNSFVKDAYRVKRDGKYAKAIIAEFREKEVCGASFEIEGRISKSGNPVLIG